MLFSFVLFRKIFSLNFKKKTDFLVLSWFSEQKTIFVESWIGEQSIKQQRYDFEEFKRKIEKFESFVLYHIVKSVINWTNNTPVSSKGVWIFFYLFIIFIIFLSSTLFIIILYHQKINFNSIRNKDVCNANLAAFRISMC